MYFFFCLLATLLIICFLTKRNIGWQEIYTTTFFGIYFRLKVDELFINQYHFYSYLTKKEHFIIFLFFPLMYGMLNYLVINWYPYKSNMLIKTVYIFLWSVSSLLIEELAIRFNFFSYIDWNMFYSALCYPVIIVILILNLEITKNFTKNLT